ncbi:hypothetical protein [Massilia niabensis]|uniref:Uncharacterized protein n=1 Tax=Massilia niabensis TaxID=544910 RepID=A0ABW0L647_9BURK
MDRRSDYKTALLIDAATHTPASGKRASPARELAGMGVPFEVAKRVLTKPAERRHPLPTAAELAAASRGADFLE